MNRSLLVVIGVALVAVACVIAEVVVVQAERAPQAEDFAHRFAPLPPAANRRETDFGSVRRLQPVTLTRGT